MVNFIHDIVTLCRTRQWIKNSYVLAPLLFSDSYHNPDRIIHSLIAVFCFCLLSSATYILNDLHDISSDQAHPRKRNRPIAAGKVSLAMGWWLFSSLIAVALILGFFLLSVEFALCELAYVANSVAYCMWLKNKVIVDVMLIAIGFVIRLIGGCFAIAVAPSSWLVICGFSLALLLGFGKRRAEVESLAKPGEHRKVLLIYDAHKLDSLLSITIAICLLSYMLYTLSPETVTRHRTDKLMYTIPFVAYGLFRYLFKAQEGKGDGPTEILTEDWVFAATGALWIVSVMLVFATRNGG